MKEKIEHFLGIIIHPILYLKWRRVTKRVKAQGQEGMPFGAFLGLAAIHSLGEKAKRHSK